MTAIAIPLENKQYWQDREDLENQITHLAGQINSANYRFLKLMAEFDAVDGWEGVGIKSFAHWLNFKCGISTTTAREKVRVCRSLNGLPLIEESFGKGEISYCFTTTVSRRLFHDDCFTTIPRCVP